LRHCFVACSSNREYLLTVAAFWGLPAYTFKGIYKELQKHHGASVQNYIIAARTAQGFDEWNKSSQAERIDAVRQWQAIQLELGKEKQQVKHSKIPPPCRFLKTRHMSFDEKKMPAEDKRKLRKDSSATGRKHSEPNTASFDTSLKHPSSEHSEDVDFEEAIQQSIAVTSKGNPEEDAAIERAIRASVQELQHASEEADGEGALRSAIQASMAEANRAHSGHNIAPHGHPEQPEAALHQNIQQRPSLGKIQTEIAELDFDDSGVDTDDGENIKAALESSRKLPSSEYQDQELERALAESKMLHDEHAESLNKAKTEEDIVMEYVKRQSLAEDAFKKSSGAQKPQLDGQDSHG